MALFLVSGLSLASEALAQCGPGAGDCCEDNLTPGCDDLNCCACICDCDPFCCDDNWDGECAGMGFVPGCGAANPEGLCAEECSFCIEVTCPDCVGDLTFSGSVGVPDLLALLGCWGPVSKGCECADLTASGGVGVPDLLALLGAWGPCPVPVICGKGAGTCCLDNDTPGCEDVECCDEICKDDPFCCDVEWDIFCAEDALALCAVCEIAPVCAASEADCCLAHVGTGCEDQDCCNCICDCDPFCCFANWDPFCAGPGFVAGCGAGNPEGPCATECSFCQAFEPCGPEAGDCCSDTETPGCDDEDCCDCICDCDPFCCTGIWDEFCAGQGFVGTCGAANPAGPCTAECKKCIVELECDCDEETSTPGCPENPACEACVCAIDDFCCDDFWDGLCAGAAVTQCAGDCCE